MAGALSALIYVLTAAIGVLAFAFPFLLPQAGTASEAQQIASTPLLTMLLLGLSLVALLVEMQGEVVSAKVVAALGMMVAVGSVLRFLETAIPGPGGFSPIFVPIILAGYVFGTRFGLLVGTLTLLVSALLTGGVGPWLPYQMFVAAWVGWTAGWLPHPRRGRAELVLLVAFSILWGFLFGFITNLYFWPYFSGSGSMMWQSGQGLMPNIQRYLAFYVATSLLWDVVRAAGNAVLLLALGLPVVRALERFRSRFQFSYVSRSSQGIG
jgi:energy-coupling factor transport system substrate-specific component